MISINSQQNEQKNLDILGMNFVAVFVYINKIFIEDIKESPSFPRKRWRFNRYVSQKEIMK